MSGHDCGNGGIYHPPGSAPNGPWNLGQAGAHIGGQWGGSGWPGQGQPGSEYKYQTFCSSLVSNTVANRVNDNSFTIVVVRCHRDLALKNELRWDQINAGAAVFSGLIALILETNQ